MAFENFGFFPVQRVFAHDRIPALGFIDCDGNPPDDESRKENNGCEAELRRDFHEKPGNVAQVRFLAIHAVMRVKVDKPAQKISHKR